MTNLTPDALSSFTRPQGSGSQVSLPSETRMMVVSSSKFLMRSAVKRTDRLMGVLPLGLRSWIRPTIFSLSIGPKATNSSTSSQSPLRRWPYATKPTMVSSGRSWIRAVSTSLAMAILAVPSTCPHMDPEASRMNMILPIVDAAPIAARGVAVAAAGTASNPPAGVSTRCSTVKRIRPLSPLRYRS